MAEPLLARGMAETQRGSRVRVWIVLLLTAAPIVLLTLRGVPSVAVTGARGMAAEFGWSNTQTGQFLSSFFTGYISSQMIGGWLADPQRLGGRAVMLICVSAATLASVATPLSSRFGLSAAVAARVVEGIAQGPLFPTMWGLVGAWLPPSEISAGSCLCNSGFGMGSMLSAPPSPRAHPEVSAVALTRRRVRAPLPAAQGLLRGALRHGRVRLALALLHPLRPRRPLVRCLAGPRRRHPPQPPARLPEGACAHHWRRDFGGHCRRERAAA